MSLFLHSVIIWAELRWERARGKHSFLVHKTFPSLKDLDIKRKHHSAITLWTKQIFTRSLRIFKNCWSFSVFHHIHVHNILPNSQTEIQYIQFFYKRKQLDCQVCTAMLHKNKYFKHWKDWNRSLWRKISHQSMYILTEGLSLFEVLPDKWKNLYATYTF